MTTTREIGARVWAIAEGYIPASSTGRQAANALLSTIAYAAS